MFQISDLDDPSQVNETDEDGMPTEETEDLNTPPYIACSLTITKSGSNSAMAIDLEAGEEGFVINNVAMLEKDLASKDGAEGDWSRRSKYMGPREYSSSIFRGGKELTTVQRSSILTLPSRTPWTTSSRSEASTSP